MLEAFQTYVFKVKGFEVEAEHIQIGDVEYTTYTEYTDPKSGDSTFLRGVVSTESEKTVDVA